ncbi:hypothetical protein HDV57DRAFT_24918 [Trichoderma longibrachiatum]
MIACCLLLVKIRETKGDRASVFLLLYFLVRAKHIVYLGTFWGCCIRTTDEDVFLLRLDSVCGSFVGGLRWCSPGCRVCNHMARRRYAAKRLSVKLNVRNTAKKDHLIANSSGTSLCHLCQKSYQFNSRDADKHNRLTPDMPNIGISCNIHKTKRRIRPSQAGTRRRTFPPPQIPTAGVFRLWIPC